MQEYPIKRGLTKDLDARIVTELKNCFGVEPVENPAWDTASGQAHSCVSM